MKIEILDGKSTIGGNKILISDKSTSIFLDFGKNFKTWGNYFEEFIQPRATTGTLYDLWQLGLLPHYSNIYREDLMLDSFEEVVKKEPMLDISAVMLSHAHLDHAGYIPFLKDTIPVISTVITKRLLKAIQDTGDGKVFSQFVDITKRLPVKDTFSNDILKSGGSKEKQPREFKVDNEGKIGTIAYKLFHTDHSIPGAMAAYLEVDGKSVAYTGDIRFCGKNKQGSFDFVKNVKNPDILITEGTKFTEDNNEKVVSENDVFNTCLDTVKQYAGKFIIADFGARNVERLNTFLNIAEMTNRKLIITIKDAYMLYVISDDFEKDPDTINIINNDNILIFAEKRGDNKAWVKEMYEKYKDRFITADKIKENVGDYIICFSFWDIVDFLDIKADGGAYIYSSSEAYTEEQIIDMNRLLNWINYFRLKPFGIKYNNGIEFDRKYHSSGHASYHEIVNMIEEIKPKILIPVHTENPLLFQKVFGKSMQVVNRLEQ